nr:reverse transcriptase domain-containing protein [Tanacetum cinerariifolium]
MPAKSTPMSQATIHQMIKDSVDAAIVAERARQVNVRNDASGSGLELSNCEDGLRKLRVFSRSVNVQREEGASYEVDLADGRVASTNTVLKGCTLNMVNHIFKYDLMPIELGTFDVIIGMDWLVKNDALIVCGEKVVRIPYGNKMLIVESDNGVS